MNEIERLDKRISFAFEKLAKAEDYIVDNLEIPKMKVIIIEFMKQNPWITKTTLRNRIENIKGGFNDYSWRAYWKSVEEFCKDKTLISHSRGRGRERLWKLKESIR